MNGEGQKNRDQKETLTWSDLYSYSDYPRTVKSHKPSLQNFQSYLQKFINSPLFVNAKKTSIYIGNHIRNIVSGDVFVIDIAMVSSIPQQSFIVGDVMKTLDDMFSISAPMVLRQDKKMNSRGLEKTPKYILIFIDEINRFVPGTYEQLPDILNSISERILRTIIAGRTRGTVLFSAQQFKSMTHPLLHENTGLHVTAKLGLSELTKRPYSDLIDNSTRANIVRLNKGELVMVHPAFRHPIRITFPDAILKRLGWLLSEPRFNDICLGCTRKERTSSIPVYHYVNKKISFNLTYRSFHFKLDKSI
jgi:hypothetical protein